MDYNSLLVQARKSISRKEFEQADGLLKEALLHQPRDPNVHFLVGSAAYARASHKDAFSAFEQALRLDPKFLPVQVAQIKVALKLRKHDYAHELASKVVEADPQNAKNCLVAAKAFSRTGENLQAARVLLQASNSSDDRHEILAQAAGYFFKAASFQEARQTAQLAYEVNPADAKPLAIVANASEMLKDRKGYMDALETLAEKEPGSAIKFLPAFISSGRLELAAQTIERARGCDVDPVIKGSLVNTLISQAANAEAKEDYVVAAKHMKVACALEPNDQNARSSLRRLSNLLLSAARSSLEGGNLQNSLSMFEQAAEIDPTNEKLLVQIARLHESNEGWLKAARIWLQLSQHEADKREGYVTRACRVARKAANSDEALKFYVEARGSLPELLPEISGWGDAIVRKVYKSGKESFEQGLFDQAFERVQLLQRWDDKGELAIKLAAKIEKKLGQDLKDAVAAQADGTSIAHRLLSLNPSRERAIRYLARRYFEQAAYAEAATWYQALADMAPNEELAWSRLLRCHGALRDFAQGKVVAKAIAERFPSNNASRLFLSKIEKKSL
jgi:tetratricopeptide (TPR) repeat protein